MTPYNVKSAWKKSGILLGDTRVVDPEIVYARDPKLRKQRDLQIRPVTPKEDVPTE